MGKKRPRPRRSFTAEYKAEIVELCQRGDRTIGQVSKDFDLTGTAVRDWVKQAELMLEPSVIPERRCSRPESKAIIKAAEYPPPHEIPRPECPFQLITGRTLYQFHRRSKTVDRRFSWPGRRFAVHR